MYKQGILDNRKIDREIETEIDPTKAKETISSDVMKMCIRLIYCGKRMGSSYETMFKISETT